MSQTSPAWCEIISTLAKLRYRKYLRISVILIPLLGQIQCCVFSEGKMNYVIISEAIKCKTQELLVSNSNPSLTSHATSLFCPSSPLPSLYYFSNLFFIILSPYHSSIITSPLLYTSFCTFSSFTSSSFYPSDPTSSSPFFTASVSHPSSSS